MRRVGRVDAELRGGSMKLSIGSRVSLAIGLLLFLFFMTSAVSYLWTKRIGNDVEYWSRVDEPRHDAVFEMQVKIADAVKILYAYALDGNQPRAEPPGKLVTGNNPQDLDQPRENRRHHA